MPCNATHCKYPDHSYPLFFGRLDEELRLFGQGDLYRLGIASDHLLSAAPGGGGAAPKPSNCWGSEAPWAMPIFYPASKRSNRVIRFGAIAGFGPG
jgi:hypothetical protein